MDTQSEIAIAEVVIAFGAVVGVLLNVASIYKFNVSLRLTRKALKEAKISREEAWRIAQGQMLLQANRDFFYQEPHKTIIRRVEMGDSFRSSPAVQDCDIDDHLGFFDTIGTFVRADILKAELVWEIFSHYIEAAHDNTHIATYLRRVRSEPNSADLFNDFEWLYQQMQSIDSSKNRKK